MSDEALDDLLAELCRGDAAAAERVFRAYEPYLRMVVRRRLTPRLRAKFDSLDIVQSVWADLLRGFRAGGCRFADAAHLRAFLVRATRNRFIDRLRQHRRALALAAESDEADADAHPSPAPRPSEVAQAEELWQQIRALCPPAHRAVLDLRREGLTPSEIAARTGLHEGSVRRILYELARRLSRQMTKSE